MIDAVKIGQPLMEDLVLMMRTVPDRDRELHMRYEEFGHFESRIRQLKTYMDSKKPKTSKQLWKDARDATPWWTFWAVAFFGAASVFLALASFAVSIAQTVGTFEALH